jgi:glycosyltransferase involved in cell wall biosynthesis
MRMGGQRSMALLIEHLDRSVIEPLAICPGPGELEDHLKVLACPVEHVPLFHVKPRTLGQVWRSSRRIHDILRERAVDIIVPDAPRDAFTCGLAKIGAPTRMVWFVRLTTRHNLDRLLQRMSDGIIGVSQATRRRFSSGARFRTIMDGVDLQRFRPPADREAVRESLGLPRDRLVLLFVGQIKPAKGVLDIVEAVGALSELRPLLLIVGTSETPEFLTEIDRRAVGLGIADSVRVLPQQCDIERWMQAADVLVSGSHEDSEGLSRVLFEAMACGAIPVATDILGNREALTPDVGVLVPERSPRAIARAITFLTSASRETLAAFRAAGACRAREKFDIRRHAREVEAFCVEIARRP